MLFVIYLFWRALRLIEQGMRRIQRRQLFSFANVFCGSSFCNELLPIPTLFSDVECVVGRFENSLVMIQP